MDVTIIDKEVKYRTSRSGGSGGQNVNKVETKVIARWNLGTSKAITQEQRELLQQQLKQYIDDEGCICVVATEDRTQLGNKIIALRKLHELITKGLRVPKKRKPTMVPPEVRLKRQQDKKLASLRKQHRRGGDW